MDNRLGSEEGEERGRRAGGVPKVYYYPCSTEGNSELFSLRRNDSERNSESFASILFHGTEARAFFLFRGMGSERNSEIFAFRGTG